MSLYLAFEAKLNDKDVWRSIEDASLTSLHLLNITEISQLEWASTQLKPKQTTPRFNTLLIKSALEKVDTASSAELMHIMQGFRNKENKGMYQTIRKTLVERKNNLKLEGNDLINMFFQFASTRPRTFGVYRFYAAEELDELLAHYEHDLNEAAD